MQIKEILSQHRRDFRALYECEHCGNTEESNGYDDSYKLNSIAYNDVVDCKPPSLPDNDKYMEYYQFWRLLQQCTGDEWDEPDYDR